MAKYIGLDLGTRSGWCVCNEDNGTLTFDYGYWDLVAGSDQSKRTTKLKKEAKDGGYSTRDFDPRPYKLYLNTKHLIDNNRDASIIAFEDVQFVRSQAQGQLWGSFRASIWLAAIEPTFKAVSVGTLKKFATGDGSADKDEMRVALKEKYKLEVEDDNAVDAIWLSIYAANGFPKQENAQNSKKSTRRTRKSST